jgi:ribosomal protein L40E
MPKQRIDRDSHNLKIDPEKVNGKICIKCGNVSPLDSRYCNDCGNEF